MVATESGAVPASGTGSVAEPRRRPAVVAALVVAAFFVAFGILHYGFYTHNLLQDTPVYERYGDAIVHGGKVPFRDFGIEYPPGALPVFAAPSLLAPAGDFLRYREIFEMLMLVCGGIASALTGVALTLQRARTSRLVAGTLLAGLAPLALGPVVLSRFDLWPAMLTVAGLAALLADRRRVAALLFGFAVAAKLYPAVVLPPAMVYVLRRHGRREALLCSGLAVGAVLAWFVPFVVLAPHGVWQSLSGQAGRPLQIESLGAALLLGAHQAWGLPLNELSSHGSDNLGGHLAHLFAAAQGVLAPTAVLATWIAFARGAATRERLVRYSVAAICAFIALGKVLSPQYLVWLIALVPLVSGRRGAAAAALFVISMVLTQLWFPQHYLELAYGFDPRASWLVLSRDLVLVALLVVLVMPERRGHRLGVAVAAGLTAAALAATVAAGARLATPSALTHSEILDETGVASGCAHAKAAPGTGVGSVRYSLSGFENESVRARCVTVTVHAEDRAQLFAAAYLRSFDPADPRSRYLGDIGSCTNTAGGTGAALHFSFVVPARQRYVVEVEQCDPRPSRPRYTLDVASSSRA
ncbi:MAG TPA: glycosyltransferase 87 family protein [Gaiellaceae bacterium]|nr:glycosyltransferase 87 family protein [Gaiellaceae bacterium]